MKEGVQSIRHVDSEPVRVLIVRYIETDRVFIGDFKERDHEHELKWKGIVLIWGVRKWDLTNECAVDIPLKG